MPVPCLFVCNASYARTFFISSYANLFIYEQFNKFIKIQQVEIFLFFIIWGQPRLWVSQWRGWPRPRNRHFMRFCGVAQWRVFQKLVKISVSDALVVSFSFLSLFFFHDFFFAVFYCVTVSYARNCFLCAFGYILVLIAILSVIIRA